MFNLCAGTAKFRSQCFNFFKGKFEGGGEGKESKGMSRRRGVEDNDGVRFRFYSLHQLCKCKSLVDARNRA